MKLVSDICGQAAIAAWLKQQLSLFCWTVEKSGRQTFTPKWLNCWVPLAMLNQLKYQSIWGYGYPESPNCEFWLNSSDVDLLTKRAGFNRNWLKPFWTANTPKNSLNSQLKTLWMCCETIQGTVEDYSDSSSLVTDTAVWWSLISSRKRGVLIHYLSSKRCKQWYPIHRV